ncbi:MAG: DUF4124 domain-containing protein [Gammaproteobacteria bacterium]
MHRIFPLTIICLLACIPAVADVHKCTDAHGKVTYRDTPCGGTSTTIRRKSVPAAAPDADARMKKTQRLLRAYDAERQEAKQQQADVQARKEERLRNCALARDRLRRFEMAGTLYNLDNEGKRVYLSDAERQQSTERARADVARWCN